MILFEDVKRSGVVVGVVYFFIYLLTSLASRSSDRFSRRFENLVVPINLTFLVGVVFLLIAGLATWQNLAIVSIIIFLLFYVLQNLRKPMNVAFISDQISHKVMASGLSVETQFTTILVAIFAPILGALADTFGVGPALAVLGAATLLFYSFVRVEGERILCHSLICHGNIPKDPLVLPDSARPVVVVGVEEVKGVPPQYPKGVLAKRTERDNVEQME